MNDLPDERRWHNGSGAVTPFRSIVLVLACVAALGCDRSDELSSVLASGGMYDTAGAAVVDYANVPPEVPVWTIADRPGLRIGRVQGEGPDVFGRIAAVVSTSDMGFVVADTRPLELKAFDRSGGFLWRAGREGEGPGEFKRIAQLLVLPGDSVLVLEGAPPRAIVFDPRGQHVRTTSLRSPDPERLGETIYHGVLSNGTIVATMATRDGSVIRQDYRRFLHELIYLARDGSIVRRGPKFFDSIIFSEQIVIQRPGGPLRATVMRSPPIAGQAIYAVHDDRVAVGVQGKGEIIVYDSIAKPLLLIRVPGRGIATDRERYTAHRIAEADPASAATVREQAEQSSLHLAATLPAHGRMMFDSAGRLWVEEFIPVYEDRQPEWWIFGRAGQFVARARFPEGFVPHQINNDDVIGVRLDAFDVPFVERRSISRIKPAA